MDYTGRIISKTPATPSANAAPGIWTLDEAMQYSKQGKWPPGYQISRSVRFRSSLSAYFNRTLASGSATTWTWSGWVKRGTLAASSFQTIFGTSNGANEAGIRFVASGGDIDRIEFYSYSGAYTGQLITTQVFRDPSAWYHFVAVYDTTNATSADRIRLYVNGVRITSFTTTVYPSTGGLINTALVHNIGAHASSSRFFDGYMTEMNFIDGQALTPASFGYFDTYTGVWQPAPYTGTYGTNGFYLNFSDNSSNTATTIGKDYSGNGNNWTPNIISVINVAAPNTNDSMVDVPINWGADTGAGGEVRGNYAVLSVPASSGWTFSNANMTGYGGTYNCYFSMPIIGKMYFEVYCSGFVGGGQVGFVKNATIALASVGYNAAGYYGVNYAPTNSYWVNGSNDATTHGTVTNQTMKFAVDGATGKVWIGSGSTWFGSGDPAAGTNPAFTLSLSTGDLIFPMLTSQQVRDTFTINTGQQPFGNAAPSGFKAMCTQNISVPTILNGANYMAATLYTGNGSTQSITNTVNGISFQPDFVWTKPRVAASSNALFDSVRGASKILISNSTGAESNLSPYGLTAFNANGFSLSDDSAGNYYVNGASGGTYSGTPPNYVGWQWKGGGTATNIAIGQYGTSPNIPSIASSVSANTTAGFSVVTYTGINGAKTIGHGLGVVPRMIIIKSRNNLGGARDWYVYNSVIGNTNFLQLDTVLGSTADSGTLWNSTSPTQDVFSVNTSGAVNNTNETYVAYCFAPISGYSAFGSYTGTSDSNGAFIYCGFRPRYILHKASSTTSQWMIWDTARNTYNVLTNAELLANSANQEGAGAWGVEIDILSNGFKFRGFDNSNFNYSGVTYIYAAFAENPFTIARAR